MPSLLDLHYCNCVLCDLLPSALWYCWIRKEMTWSQLLKEKIEGQLANPDSSKHVKLACVCVCGSCPWAAQPGGFGGDIVPLTFGTRDYRGYSENDLSGDYSVLLHQTVFWDLLTLFSTSDWISTPLVLVETYQVTNTWYLVSLHILWLVCSSVVDCLWHVKYW